MEHLADEFIERCRAIAVGRGKRYPESLRQLAVGFATEAAAAGWRSSRIARRLGVAWATLERWCAANPEVSGMREVLLRDEAVSSSRLGAVLVTPEGYRIEGLLQAELVELLRALRQ